MLDKFLNNIYSKETSEDKVKFKILGIKVSKKKNKKTKQINISKLKKNISNAICNSEVEYVSFDIFDTLLVRPCIKPSDIFAFISEIVDEKYNINFYEIRKKAEASLNNPNANIYDIYNHIQKIYSLSEETKEALLNEEIKIESQLLSPREDIKEFYDLAIKNNKKIIAISDMYLPSNILHDILAKKGFDKIQKVYVSNEYKARKDSGLLYDKVTDELKTKNIVHIGDNKHSDYNVPLNKEISAHYYPSVIEILYQSHKLFKKLINPLLENKLEVSNKNMLLGFTLNNYWFKTQQQVTKNCIFNNIQEFTNLFLAPYLTYISLLMQKNFLIQKNYKNIYFVARDGYLPLIAYNKLNNGKYLKGTYVYGSRVSYWTGIYNSIYDFLNQEHKLLASNYTIQNFINSYISDTKTKEKLFELYSNNELNTQIRDNYSKSIEILNKADSLFKDYFNQQQIALKTYYQNIFKDDNERIIVFDVGYNGSVSIGLSKIVGKSVDKIYIHESKKNIFRDNHYKTHTFILKNGECSQKYRELDLLFEECFSPLEGTCTGFFLSNDKEAYPTVEEIKFSENMKTLHKNMLSAVDGYLDSFLNTFGKHSDILNITDIDELFNLVIKAFANYPLSKNFLNDILYNDTALLRNQIPLGQKIGI